MQTNNSVPRFFGGHYDSMKQASVRDYIYQKISPNSDIRPQQEMQKFLDSAYTARMRLDILLAGDIVITDAQYYDGTFFHILANSDFLEACSTLKPEKKVFEIRTRAGGLLSMVNKRFTFSALSSDTVRKEVNQTVDGVLEKNKERSRDFQSAEHAFRTYISALDKSIKSEFQGMAENILSLEKDTPTWMFGSWDPKRDIRECRKQALQDLPFKYPFGENEEADEVLKMIQQELSKDWNRTQIWESVNKFRNSRSVLQDSTKDDPVEQVWAWFMKLYNRAAAYQHECNCLDVGEDIVYSYTDTKADDEYRRRIEKELSGDILEGLTMSVGEVVAKETWKEFFHRINTEPIKSTRQTWRNAKVTALNMPPLMQKTYLLKPLNNLVTAIRESYGMIGSVKEVSKKAAFTLSEFGILVFGGALQDVHWAPGIVIGTIIVPMITLPLLKQAYDTGKTTIGDPREQYNMIKIGLRSSDSI